MHGGLYQSINELEAGRGTNPYWNKQFTIARNTGNSRKRHYQPRHKNEMQRNRCGNKVVYQTK